MWNRFAIAIALAALPMAAQTAKIPRMPDGHPDLQGTYDLATITPLERLPGDPPALTKDKAEALEKAEAARRAKDYQPSRADRPAPPVGGDTTPPKSFFEILERAGGGAVGGYNRFWLNQGTAYTVVDGQIRTSIVVDPPDGHVPPLNAAARKRLAAARATPTSDTRESQDPTAEPPGAFDNPEQRPLGERCLLGFGSTSGPPALPDYFYNDLHQIVQTPDSIMILTEMVHDARIVRMNAQHLPQNIRRWMGDSVGRWEGDTLVVDTTNFNDKTRFRNSTGNLHVVERFTRLDNQTLLYRFTVEDPDTWDRPWTGEYTWPATDKPIYEYACHEGNYALGDILRGARKQEAEEAAHGAAVAAPHPNNYADAKSWLCRPGQHDACDTDLATTVVSAGGSVSSETWAADPNAPIDCFYVYPTVSTDPTPNSDMIPDEAERNVIRQQFARFASKCKPYAPMYRQITLAGLRTRLAGGGGPLDSGVQYDDVRDAWNYYLEHDNRGRGFVLVSHSQGSFILARLIREEIDGKPVQARMVSAILLGTTLAVPRGKDVGGTFQHVPLCHSASQTGCVITYASFRSTLPPPANTLFGKVAGPNMTAACTNPAALAGGSGELHAYLSTKGQTIVGTTPPKPWVIPEKPIDTPWVSVPGMLTAKCASNENATYLEVTVHSDPAGRRAGDIRGDLLANGQVQANWGLHLIDVNLSMGNLIDIVGQQAKAWR